MCAGTIVLIDYIQTVYFGTSKYFTSAKKEQTMMPYIGIILDGQVIFQHKIVYCMCCTCVQTNYYVTRH